MTLDMDDHAKEPPTVAELEASYKQEFPGFEPLVWSAMAYFALGLSPEDANERLKERYGERLKQREDECKARVQEIEEALKRHEEEQTSNGE